MKIDFLVYEEKRSGSQWTAQAKVDGGTRTLTGLGVTEEEARKQLNELLDEEFDMVVEIPNF
jgi:hypothetical protein